MTNSQTVDQLPVEKAKRLIFVDVAFRLVSPGCGYLGDEKRSRVFFFLPSLLFINAEEILPPPTTGAGGLLIILYAVKIFDVPQLLMSGYEKCLAQFKPLAKKKNIQKN